MAKILIMDDEPGLRNVTFSMLKPTGHSLFLAEDGKEAIDIARKEKPDLALLDMRVPDMDGLEVVAELKKMDPTVQCIMLSGFGDVETAVGAIKKGAFDYISKPFKVNEVLEVINKALAAKQKSSGGAAPSQGHQSVAQAASDGPTGAINVPSSYVPPKKPPMALIAGAIAAAAIIAVTAILGLSGPKRVSYSLTYMNPSALAFDGKNLWIADWVGRSIYRHNIDKTLSVANVVAFPEHIPVGIAWDGSNLWSCDNMSGLLVKHIPNQHLTNIVALKTSFSPSVMGFDAGYLWTSDNGGKVYRFRVGADGGMVGAGTFDAPASQVAGIFFREGHVWITDADTARVYKQEPNSFAVAGVFTLKPYDKSSEKPSSVIFDGKHIWSCVDGSGKVYRHPVTDLVPLK